MAAKISLGLAGLAARSVTPTLGRPLPEPETRVHVLPPSSDRYTPPPRIPAFCAVVSVVAAKRVWPPFRLVGTTRRIRSPSKMPPGLSTVHVAPPFVDL